MKKAANLIKRATSLNSTSGDLKESNIIFKGKARPSSLNIRAKQKIEKQKVQKIKDEETQHAKPEWEPKNWRPLWDAIQTVRDTIKAPVDELGCEELSRNYDRFPEKEKVYHNLVGLMLSSQTKDEVTHATLRYLVDVKSLTMDVIMNTKESDLNSWIAKVGFHNKKAVYIK